jgi:hypothetical protein
VDLVGIEPTTSPAKPGRAQNEIWWTWSGSNRRPPRRSRGALKNEIWWTWSGSNRRPPRQGRGALKNEIWWTWSGSNRRPLPCHGKELYLSERRCAPVNIPTKYPQLTTNKRLVCDRTPVYSRVQEVRISLFLPLVCRKFGGSAVEFFRPRNLATSATGGKTGT